MTGEDGFENLLAAPIVDDSRFLIFSVRSDKNGNRRLFQTLASELPDELASKVTNFPVVDWEGSGQSGKFTQAHSLTTLPAYLRSVTVINSKQAGGSLGGEIYFNILSPLLKAFGVQHVYVATDSAQTISAHARSFSSSATVIIIGGDTSVHEFVNFLPPSRNTQLRLAIIPAGTGNALMSSLGVVSPLQAVQNLFLNTSFTRLSTFKVTFPQGSRGINTPGPLRTSYQALVVASWGFHAALVAEADSYEMRKLGPERFQRAARDLVANVDQKYYGTVQGTPSPINSPLSYLLFTTVTNLEPTFPISPLSEPPSSGKLYCVAIPAVENQELMDIMYKVYDKSSHVNDPRVVYQRVPGECTVVVGTENTQESMRTWCVDGCVVQVPPGIVTIHKPTLSFNGWDLYINC